MMPRRFDPLLAFEPPSDFTPDSSPSRGKKIWMVLGGGCLVVLLVIGIAFAAGAFKVVKCCGQFSDVAMRTIEAQNYGVGFASDLGEGRVDEAYERTSDGFKGRVTAAAFKEMVSEYEEGLKVAPPRLLQNRAIQVDGSELGELKQWRTSVQFSGGSSTEMTVVSMDVVLLSEDPIAFAIDDVDFDVRARDLASEPAAVEVLAFHNELQMGNEGLAFGRLGEAFKTETDLETFRTFVVEQGDIMSDSDLEIKEVTYEGPQSATVVAFASTESGQKAVIEYALAAPFPNLPAWQIVAISPLVETVPDVEQNELLDAGTSDQGAADSDGTAVEDSDKK